MLSLSCSTGSELSLELHLSLRLSSAQKIAVSEYFASKMCPHASLPNLFANALAQLIRRMHLCSKNNCQNLKVSYLDLLTNKQWYFTYEDELYRQEREAETPTGPASRPTLNFKRG